MELFDFSFLLKQLMYIGPLLFVYLVGLVVAFIYLRKAPIPAIITIIAAVIQILTTIVWTGAQAYLFHAQRSSAWGYDSFSNWLNLIGIAASLVHTFTIALLLLAVFIGRSHANSHEVK